MDMDTPAELAHAIRPPWYRRIKPWQFSLRTMLVLMAVVSAACWYYLLPQRDEEKLADGYLILKREYRHAVDVVGAPSPGGPGMQLVHDKLNDGYWQLADFQGRLLVDGRYRRGTEHGWWTTHHPNGRMAVQGRMKHGQRVGQWQTWSPSGQLLTEVTYQAPAATPKSTWKTNAESISQLHGPAKFFHETGKLAAEGTYRANERHGPSRAWNEQGQLIAAGEYLAGKKHGPWQERLGDGKTLTTNEYVHGLLKTALEAQLREIAEKLQTGDVTERLVLLSSLGDFGEPALPLLQHYAQNANQHVQLAAISALDLCRSDLKPWLTPLKNLAESTDPRIATAASWLIYRRFPDDRDAHLAALLLEAEELASQSWTEAFDRLREMFVLERRHRPEIFLALLRIAPSLEGVAYVSALEVDDHSAGGQAIATWQLEVIPYLEQALADPESPTRRSALKIIRQLLIENGEQTFKQAGNGIKPVWGIPPRLAPLLAKARRDDDPKVREAAEKVDENNNSYRRGGGGGLGGGGGMF